MRNLIIIFFAIFSGCSINSEESMSKRDVYYVKSAGAELPVITFGADNSNIILYVHGGPGSTSLQQFYSPLFQDLKKTYRIVMYDQRGSGGARGHISPASLTLDQHVEDLDAVINSINIKYPNSSIYMIGASYGGMVSSAYASVHQNKLKGLVLLVPALNIVDMSTRIPDNILKTFIIPYLERTDISSKDRTYWEEAKSFYQNNIPLKLDSFIIHNSYVCNAYPIYIPEMNQYDDYNSKLLSKLLADPVLEPIIIGKQVCLLLPVLDQNKESQRNLETDPKFNLSQITIPSMMIVGELDLTVPHQSSINSYTKVRGKKTEIMYEGTGHDPIIQRKDRLYNDITNFIINN